MFERCHSYFLKKKTAGAIRVEKTNNRVGTGRTLTELDFKIKEP